MQGLVRASDIARDPPFGLLGATNVVFLSVLGLGFAVLLAVLNAMWLEHCSGDAERDAVRDKR